MSICVKFCIVDTGYPCQRAINSHISQRHDAVVAACGRARTVADDRHNNSFFFVGVRFTAGFAVRCFCVLCFLWFPGRRRFRLH